MYAGTNPGYANDPARRPPGRRRASCCRNRRRGCPGVAVEHRLHVAGHAGEAPLLVSPPESRAATRRRLDREAGGDVSIQRIVRRGLVRDQIRFHSPAHELREDFRRIPHHPMERPSRAPPHAAPRAAPPRATARACPDILLHAPPRARRVDFDADEHRSAHRRRERLRPAHAAEPGADHQPPGKVVRPEVLASRRRERLVGACRIPGCHIDPGTGGHLAVHDSGQPARARGTSPRWPISGPDSSSRSAPAARRHACAARRPASRSAPARSRRPPTSAGSSRSARSWANRAPFPLPP